jgi:hypothetical protein
MSTEDQMAEHEDQDQQRQERDGHKPRPGRIVDPNKQGGGRHGGGGNGGRGKGGGSK